MTTEERVAVVAEERERCAQVCDAFAEKWGYEPEACADAIRDGVDPEQVRQRLKGL